jgi:hypothetical protein
LRVKCRAAAKLACRRPQPNRILGETGEQIAALLNANNERDALLKHTRDAC